MRLACVAINARSSRSFVVNAGTRRLVSGTFTPLPLANRLPPGRACVISTAIRPGFTVRTTPPILPSSNHTASPGLAFGKSNADAGRHYDEIAAVTNRRPALDPVMGQQQCFTL